LRKIADNYGSYPMSPKSSAIAGGPRDALCQSKCCQMLRHCTKDRILKGLHVCDLESYSMSPEMAWFGRLYVISYTNISCTKSEILSLL